MHNYIENLLFEEDKTKLIELILYLRIYIIFIIIIVVFFGTINCIILLY